MKNEVYMDKKVYDIIIIGAGTAGLSSAIYGKSRISEITAVKMQV